MSQRYFKLNMSRPTSVPSHKICLFSWIPDLAKAAPFITHPSSALTSSFSLFHMSSQLPSPCGFSLSLSLSLSSLRCLQPRKPHSLSRFVSELSVCSPDFQVTLQVLHITTRLSSSNPDLVRHSYVKLIRGFPQGTIQRATEPFVICLGPPAPAMHAFSCAVIVPTVTSEYSFIL